MVYTQLQRDNELTNCPSPCDFPERFLKEGEVYNTQVGRIEILRIADRKVDYFGRGGVVEGWKIEEILKLHPRWIDPERIRKRN